MVIGDSEPRAFAAMAEQYRQYGFNDFKIKLSGDLASDQAKVRVLQGWNLPSLRLRADANNLWDSADAAIRFIDALGARFWAVEEPIGANRDPILPASARPSDVGSCWTRASCGSTSSTRCRQPPRQCGWSMSASRRWAVFSGRWTWCTARAREVMASSSARRSAKTSSTRAGLTVAQSAGADLVAQEGAFGTHLLQDHVVDVPVMFGLGGMLDLAGSPVARRPGLGLDIRDWTALAR